MSISFWLVQATDTKRGRSTSLKLQFASTLAQQFAQITALVKMKPTTDRTLI